MEDKIVIRVDMEDPVVKDLERVNLEANARMAVLSYLMNSGAPIDQEAFDRYHSEYVKYHGECDRAKEEVARKYELNKYGPEYAWSINFNTHEIEIARRA